MSPAGLLVVVGMVLADTGSPQGSEAPEPGPVIEDPAPEPAPPPATWEDAAELLRQVQEAPGEEPPGDG